MFSSTFTFDGKRYYVRSSVSQREADRKAAEKKLRMEQGRDLITSEMRFSDYAAKWVETYKRPTVSDPVYKANLSRLRLHVNPLIGAMQMKSIRHTHLQKVMNADKGKSKNHYVKLRDMLVQIFQQARRDHIIIEDPSEGLKLPVSQDGSNRSITDAERAAILKVAEYHRMGVFVSFILWCGLRPQEAARIRWEDIDQINRRLHVCRALKSDGSTGRPKSDAGDRWVPIPPYLWDRLEIPDRPTGYICKSARGDCLSKTAIRNGWSDFKRLVDIELGAELMTDVDGSIVYAAPGKPMIIKSVVSEDLTLYCLRHTYCTDLQAADVPIDEARYIMGHSNINLTSRIYTHMRDDTFSKIEKRIQAFSEKRSTTSFSATPGATPFCKIESKEVKKEDSDKKSGGRSRVRKSS